MGLAGTGLVLSDNRDEVVFKLLLLVLPYGR